VTGIRDFVWILAVRLAINAQLANGDPGCGKNVSFRPGVSPFDIVAGNPPLPNLWARLGIPARLKASSGNEINCLDGCEASIVSSDYLLPAGNDTVVRVCTAFGDTCRFLLLHQSSSVWSLVDYLDTDYDKYELPTAWIEASQDQRWLVKSSFGGGGTGVYLGIAEWFEIRCGALENILKVPLKGEDVNAKPARYFSTRFKGFTRQASVNLLNSAIWYVSTITVMTNENSGRKSARWCSPERTGTRNSPLILPRPTYLPILKKRSSHLIP